MSVSLCALVLEVPDDSDLIPDLHYTASKCLESTSKKRDKFAASNEVGEIESHRGRRITTTFTIETYIMMQEESLNKENEEDGSEKENAKGTTRSRHPSKEKQSSNETFRWRKDTKEPSPMTDPQAPGREREQISFVSGNPYVEVTKGILHLYKENEMTDMKGESGRSEMLCILAIPASMTSHDILQFVAPCHEVIEHIRIIRDNSPNQYMVLLKFRSPNAADDFYKTYNGVQFNSIEPEVCYLLYVSRVETTKEGEGACLPLAGHTELPMCPVCLERMDESVDGILTILCNHSFHGACLAKWGDTSCPVCRYVQTPEMSDDNRCEECHTALNLWICLICGNVGCGRYESGHAYRHFAETSHTYAMNLGSNRVWDYVGDNFVHRLLQSNQDGKLVELSESGREYSQEAKEDAEGKFESIQLEYTYMLTSQLESQRHYYEDKIMKLEKSSRKEIEDLKERCADLKAESVKWKDKVTNINKEKQAHEKKLSALNAKLTKANNDIKEEKQLNTFLRQDQVKWQKQLSSVEQQLQQFSEEKNKEVSELKDQVRDLMFFLEAKDKISAESEDVQRDIQEGQIVVGAAAASPQQKGQRRRKGH